MTTQVFHGIGASSGIAVGRAHLVHAEPLPVVPTPVPPERIDQEIARFERARDRAREELEELRHQVLEVLGEPYAGILDAQKLILDDPALVRETTYRIRIGRISARWALKEVVAAFTDRFNTVADEYIRERGGELSDVHRRLQRLLRGETPHATTLPEGPLVVVSHALGPADAIVLARNRVVGLVTDAGGRTSHTAILAQALCLPAVVGLRDFSRRVRETDTIVVDGDSGEVVLAPGPEERAVAERRRAAWTAREHDMVTSRDLPAITRDGEAVAIRANIELPREVDAVLRYGAQGIGLYRSEFLFLSHAPGLPGEEEHYRTYREIAERVAPHPATIRTLDLGGEKYFHDVLDPSDTNPVLGLRAIRFCLQRPDIFRPQLRGLLRAAATQPNLRMLLPLVTNAGEVRAVRALVREEVEQLRASGLGARADIPLGIMIEVPAAALASDLLAGEADFFSIGTNDLIQYALAVDRGNVAVADLYHPLHPGVLRMLRLVLDVADRRGLPVALCGEMAADPATVGLLLGLGLRELSVQPRAVAQVREAVRAVDTREARELAAAALDRDAADRPERPLEMNVLIRRGEAMVERVDKPWGYELRFARTDRYAGKVLFIRAGQQLSLQYHERKDEAFLVHEGQLELVLGRGDEQRVVQLGPGEAWHVRPPTVHRFRARTDCLLFEVSTPELEDVVRLEDDYGREGQRDDAAR